MNKKIKAMKSKIGTEKLYVLTHTHATNFQAICQTEYRNTFTSL